MVSVKKSDHCTNHLKLFVVKSKPLEKKYTHNRLLFTNIKLVSVSQNQVVRIYCTTQINLRNSVQYWVCLESQINHSMKVPTGCARSSVCIVNAQVIFNLDLLSYLKKEQLSKIQGDGLFKETNQTFADSNSLKTKQS